ncbi:tost-1 [Pristionchus pacificus]|uniref:Uncharacterized protein n=1 Tax=Pristionchus pacificus TaxID=54126 RepID=A0A2A6CHK0_PRIPA|nr:tost-1 [Pristionchus pacificus]|eukprot:PDM77543.1 hypothetical protein PRIPAC_34410 [Pristionchus pacificus]
MTTSSQECSPAVSPVPQIRSFPHRIIRPLADKEAIQRNFVTLPNRAANFSNRNLTLNERFGIIERGYYLESHPDDIPCELEEHRLVNLVPLTKQATLEEVMAELAEATAKRNESKKKRTSVSPNPCESTASSP